MTSEFDGAVAIEALEKLGVLKAACPMCGKKASWDVGDDGFFELATLQPDDADESREERARIGTVAVQCGNCGFVALHARSVLGLGRSTDDPPSS